MKARDCQPTNSETLDAHLIGRALINPPPPLIDALAHRGGQYGYLVLLAINALNLSRLSRTWIRVRAFDRVLQQCCLSFLFQKFFIRSSKNENYAKYSCSKVNACEVNKDTRTHCQRCRFYKCIRIGMVLPGMTLLFFHQSNRQSEVILFYCCSPGFAGVQWVYSLTYVWLIGISQLEDCLDPY